MGSDFLHHAPAAIFHGLHGHAQCMGNFLVGLSIGNPLQNLLFADCEGRERFFKVQLFLPLCQ
jgi:hypothetical protein